MAAHQAPPSLGFSRQEHWSGLPFPSPMHESEKWKWSCFSRVRLFATPWTVAFQAPLSMGFSTQEYWSGEPLPSPLSHWGSPNKAVSTQQKGFPSGSVVKNPPAMQELQEAWVWFLAQKDSLEEGMATHCSILAWRIPWTEEPGGLQSIGWQRVGHD